MAATAKVLSGDIVGVLQARIEAQKNKPKGPVARCCALIWPPFLLNPCSLEAILQVVQGNFHICILSTFIIYVVVVWVYSTLFGWQVLLLYIAFGLAVVGPCWTSMEISGMLKLAGPNNKFQTEVNELLTTSRDLRGNLLKYKSEIGTLTASTYKVTQRSHEQRKEVRKALNFGQKMHDECTIIETDQLKNLEKNTGKITHRKKTINKRMKDFADRVDEMIRTQEEMYEKGQAMEERQLQTEEIIGNLKQVPVELDKGVRSIQWVKGFYVSAGTCSRAVAPMVEQMGKEYNRFANVVRLQEMALMRTIAFDISEENGGRAMTKQDFRLFVDRLPTYLSESVHTNRIRFNNYSMFRYGATRRIQRAGLHTLLTEILDGVSSRLTKQAAMPEFALLDMSSKFAY